jgi:hypothetical protein
LAQPNKAAIARAVNAAVQQEYGTGFLLCAALAVVGARVATASTGEWWVAVGGRIEIEIPAGRGGDVLALGPPGQGYHSWLTAGDGLADFSLWQFGKQGKALPDYAWGPAGEIGKGLGVRYFAFPDETAMVRQLGRDNKGQVQRMTERALGILG